jgi:broad specificity phosphatase PhoE
MKLYFARHGESEANLLRVFSNRGVKHGLTEEGRAQARILAQTLQSASVTRLFSSPLLRATQTAEIVAEVLGLRYEITDALREYDCGVWEGRSDAAGWEEYERVLAAWIEKGDWQQRMEGGESFDDMRVRFVPPVEQLVEQYGHSPAGIGLIGHGGLYRCMLPLVLENIEHDFALRHPISHTGLVVAEQQGGKLICTVWAGNRLAMSPV